MLPFAVKLFWRAQISFWKKLYLKSEVLSHKMKPGGDKVLHSIYWTIADICILSVCQSLSLMSNWLGDSNLFKTALPSKYF